MVVKNTIISRSDRGLIAKWWWTVDRIVLTSFFALIVIGILLSIAASPSIAIKKGLDDLHFFKRHLIFLVPALGVLFITSILPIKLARRLSIIALVMGIILMLLTLLIGMEINGARRWLNIGGFTVQPSEFVKPAFIVTSAWLFSSNIERPDMPGNYLAIALYLLFVSIMVLQRDYGQTILISAVWGIMFFVAGLSLYWIMTFAGIGFVGLVLSYFTQPHFARRIDTFLDPSSGDNYQVNRSIEAIIQGGLLGRGPGEGSMKAKIPDVHTDFIFAAAPNDFGLFAGLLIVGIFAFITLLNLWKANKEKNRFLSLAVIGLSSVFGLQAIINISVALALVPAKGMTLPFISYGGSSLLATAFTAGLILAFTRRRAIREVNSNSSVS